MWSKLSSSVLRNLVDREFNCLLSIPHKWCQADEVGIHLISMFLVTMMDDLKSYVTKSTQQIRAPVWACQDPLLLKLAYSLWKIYHLYSNYVFMSFYLCFLALYSPKLSEYSVYCYAAIGVINDQ